MLAFLGGVNVEQILCGKMINAMWMYETAEVTYLSNFPYS